MEFIDNKLRRYTTFSKRKTGIMKKAYELSTLTGTQVMLLVASETGHVYTFATRKLQPMITSEAGKALIQTSQEMTMPWAHRRTIGCLQRGMKRQISATMCQMMRNMREGRMVKKRRRRRTMTYETLGR